MLKRTLLASLLLLALTAGCVDPADDQAAPEGNFGGYEGTGLYAGPALWEDPQNFPHPMYNWPTLSSPANGTNVPRWWQPIQVAELPDHISGLDFVGRAGADQDVTAGAGIALFGSLAVVPSDGWNGAEGGWVVDISDPTHPQRLGVMETTGRGAAIIAYPNGRLVTVVSTTAGFDTVDITDPLNPVVISNVTPTEGGHKLGVVPGTPFVYNAGSGGGDPGVPGVAGHPLYGPGLCNASIDQCVGYTSIYDMSDPEAPVLVQEFQNGLACHHIFFWNAVDGSKQRAICAGIQYTQLWDTSDPANPTVIVNVPVHHGTANTPSGMLSVAAFSHTAGLNLDGTILYVGDENMGGSLPPGCGAGTQATDQVGQLGTPVGATWFYDVSDETDPQVMGYFSPPRDAEHQVDRSCTTHHGRLVPDKEGRDLLAMSFYNDGSILIDFTPAAEGVPVVEPKVIGEYNDGSDTWETWYYGGYLFLGDLNHGLDVVGFT